MGDLVKLAWNELNDLLDAAFEGKVVYHGV